MLPTTLLIAAFIIFSWPFVEEKEEKTILEHEHLLCFGYYLIFSLLGFLLSKTIRYPPLLDIIYFRTRPAYCAKVLLALLMYHVLCLPFFLFDMSTQATLAFVLCIGGTIVWSAGFYFILISDEIEHIKWQDRRSAATFLFYFNVFLIFVLCFQMFLGDSKNVVLSNALIIFLTIVLLRVTIFRNRNITKLTRAYAQEKFEALVNRHWFGFPVDHVFDSDAEKKGKKIAFAYGNTTATAKKSKFIAVPIFDMPSTTVAAQPTTTLKMSHEEKILPRQESPVLRIEPKADEKMRKNAQGIDISERTETSEDERRLQSVLRHIRLT